MNVIIIPVDQNASHRSLLPLLGQWLQAAGDSSARIRHLCEPPTDPFSASSGQRLAQIVERYANRVHIFLRCLDGNGLQGQEASLGGSNEALVRRRTFWGEGAWESLSGWLLKSFDPQAPLWVPDLSGEVRAAVQDAGVGSAASLVEVASRDWLDRNDLPIDEAEKQRQIREETAPFIGSVRGLDPNLAQEASQRVRTILEAKYER